MQFVTAGPPDASPATSAASPLRTALPGATASVAARVPPHVTVSRIRAADGSVVTVAVYSVRQNLWLLVQGGQPTAEAAWWFRWGGTIGHAEYVARSALGQDASGDLSYAASMSTTPEDLAQVLARSGARIAMELDINPEWIQLAIAHTPGSPLRAPVPGQVRPVTQYLTGWTRDFITVLAPG